MVSQLNFIRNSGQRFNLFSWQCWIISVIKDHFLSLNLAHISVLHKSGKDPLQCSSYRPISLLDHDYKIITKLFARRLDSVLSKLINPDQSGFIKGRYASDNIRRVLNVINFLNNQQEPSLLLSLDVEKAFDRVEWNFLFSVIHKFNLGVKLYWMD